MKKALVNTRVSVKLRKSEYRDEWWKIQCKLPPKTKRFCPLVLK